jgi:hypothetical protein
MVITQEAAQKYFGDSDPIGHTLQYDGKWLFEVTGVAANPPSNSTIDFDFVCSSASAKSMHEADDDSTNATIGHGRFTTYLLLRDAGHTDALGRLMTSMSKYGHAKFGALGYSLRALVHLHNDSDTPTNVKYRKIFPVVAGLILLLALINYLIIFAEFVEAGIAASDLAIIACGKSKELVLGPPRGLCGGDRVDGGKTKIEVVDVEVEEIVVSRLVDEDEALLELTGSKQGVLEVIVPDGGDFGGG